MLRTTELTYRYPGHTPLVFPALECVPGTPLLLMGPSGCGKTTFMHMAAGLLSPLEGKVIVDGVDINTIGKGKKDRFRGKHIGIVFQTPHFISSLTLAENMEAAMHFAGQSVDKGRIEQLCERLGLSNNLKKKPSTLSQGQMQRAGVARAVINSPGLILADEPTSGLDDYNCDQTLDLLIHESEATGAALLIITHDARLKSRISHQISL